MLWGTFLSPCSLIPLPVPCMSLQQGAEDPIDVPAVMAPNLTFPPQPGHHILALHVCFSCQPESVIRTKDRDKTPRLKHRKHQIFGEVTKAVTANQRSPW